MNQLYSLALAMMSRPLVPGFVSLGAILLRALREADLDDERQDRMWVSAHAILEYHKRSI